MPSAKRVNIMSLKLVLEWSMLVWKCSACLRNLSRNKNECMKVFFVICRNVYLWRGSEERGRIEMSKNTGENYRIGAVKNRSQVYNPKTHSWVKRGEDGRFINVKTSSNSPFKGVRKEK
ncbi:hypothetical protein CS060_13095 [Anoxybacillus flavithermus]|uniref:Uncharacterized protein n=2 Tax=Anoxybacillaceae TaxID=3120669 RepID=A0A2G5RM67_9BACL|nr:hypothetical protein CS060_13095 [Anoxybacillus flavithermus]